MFEENNRRFETEVGRDAGSRTSVGTTPGTATWSTGSADAADRALPPDATVLVVSHGDDELLELGAARRGWHFPQQEDGV